MNLSLWRTKKAPFSGRRSERCTRLRIGPDRPSLGRSPHAYFRNHRISLNRSNIVFPFYFSYLARAYAELGQFDDAWRCIGEATTAVETTKERWFEAEVHRIAGEIALMSPKSRKRRKRKRISSVRSRSRVSSKQSPGNSAPR